MDRVRSNENPVTNDWLSFGVGISRRYFHSPLYRAHDFSSSKRYLGSLHSKNLFSIWLVHLLLSRLIFLTIASVFIYLPIAVMQHSVLSHLILSTHQVAYLAIFRWTTQMCAAICISVLQMLIVVGDMMVFMHQYQSKNNMPYMECAVKWRTPPSCSSLCKFDA